MEFKDFEIVIDRTANIGTYSVSIVRPCGGEIGDATSNFDLLEISDDPIPVIPNSVENLLRDIEPITDVIGETDMNLRFRFRTPSPFDEINAEGFGKRLAQALFKGQVRDAFVRCRELIVQEQGLRLRMNLSRVPELAAIPWEYIRFPDDVGGYMALNPAVSIVRYLQTPNRIPRITVRPPLRILLAASSPRQLPRLDLDTEISQINNGLSQLIDNHLVEITVCSNAKLADISEILENANREKRPIHVLHFLGHGAFDQQNQSGVLILEDGDGNPLAVSGEELGIAIQTNISGPNLRLIILNSCEGAVPSISDVYASVAGKVLQMSGVPALIGMQYKITDTAAVKFATWIYKEIVEGRSIENAVTNARRSLSSENGKEWVSPVLYLLSDGGDLLEVRRPQVPAHAEGHYRYLRTYLGACKAVCFLGLDINGFHRPPFERWEPRFGPPTTRELCEYIREQLNIEQVGALPALAQLLSMRDETEDLSPFFRDLFERWNEACSNGDSPKIYNILAQITKRLTERFTDYDNRYAVLSDDDPARLDIPLRSNRSLLFVTSTYDQELERSFRNVGIEKYHLVSYAREHNGLCSFLHKEFVKGQGLQLRARLGPTAKNANEYTVWRTDAAPVILKLPGEFQSFDVDTLNDDGLSLFAVAEDDFFSFAATPLERLLPADIISQLKESRHVYLGYDVQNWAFRLLRARLSEGQVMSQPGSYAVVFSEDHPDVRFWRRNGVLRIPVNPDDYVEGLEKLVLQDL